jgi:hypothetical protein
MLLTLVFGALFLPSVWACDEWCLVDLPKDAEQNKAAINAAFENALTATMQAVARWPVHYDEIKDVEYTPIDAEGRADKHDVYAFLKEFTGRSLDWRAIIIDWELALMDDRTDTVIQRLPDYSDEDGLWGIFPNPVHPRYTI